MKKITLKEFKAIESPDFVAPPYVQRCYSCGSTESFNTYYDSWSGEYDVVCNKCHSDHTALDGESEPLHECGAMGWDCWDCNKFLCKECWDWHDKKNEHEEDVYICHHCE